MTGPGIDTAEDERPGLDAPVSPEPRGRSRRHAAARLLDLKAAEQ